MDCSLPGSSVPGILQAGILEWVAISFTSYVLRAHRWPLRAEAPEETLLLPDQVFPDSPSLLNGQTQSTGSVTLDLWVMETSGIIPKAQLPLPFFHFVTIHLRFSQ